MSNLSPSLQQDLSTAYQAPIAQWLSKLRFRRQLLGGVSEADVWKKLEELNKLYAAALLTQQAHYEALLAQGEASTGVRHGE